MNDPRTCTHEAFGCACAVTFIEDRKCWNADIKIACTQCGEPFKFLGLPAGLSFLSPRVSITADALRAPIAPMGKPELAATASFDLRRRDS